MNFGKNFVDKHAGEIAAFLRETTRCKCCFEKRGTTDGERGECGRLMYKGNVGGGVIACKCEKGYGSHSPFDGACHSSVERKHNGANCFRYTNQDFPDLRYEDTCFGCSPRTGIITIEYREKVCWTMVYSGSLLRGADGKAVNGCIRRAILAAMKNKYFCGGRGQNNHHDNKGLTYHNDWKGTLKDFHGFEYVIDNHGNWLYKMNYRGGFINL